MNLSEIKAENVLTDAELKRILKDFFEGKTDIPEDVFWKNYKKLSEGVSIGYGSLTEVGDATLVYQLKNNVAVFSAFKANHYAAAMHSLLVDEKGVKREWGNFLKEAQKVDAKYNKTWLAAEYNMATRQARSAKQWQDFERDKDVYPNLKYMPSRSATPDLTHTKYYGLVYPIDHPFWNNGMPPLRWGCKCYVTQTRDEATDDIYEAPEPPEGVAGNSGKTGKVFTASSHYLDGLKKEGVENVDVFMRDMQAKNLETILYKVGKNNIEIPVTADKLKLREKLVFLEAHTKNNKENYAINPLSNASINKNPPLKQAKSLGSFGKWEKAKSVNSFVKTGWKKGYSNQLKGKKAVFVSLDFNGKLTAKNSDEMWRALYGEIKQANRLKFILLKNGDKTLKIVANKLDQKKELDKIKKELI